MNVCAKFQLSSWSRSGLKVPGGVVGCGGVEAHFNVQLKPKPRMYVHVELQIFHGFSCLCLMKRCLR